MKPIRLQRTTVRGVQTHRYKHGKMLVPGRFITTPQPVWSVVTTSNSVTGGTHEDAYYFESITDAVIYITIMARGYYVITDDTWQTLATQLPPRKVREIEKATSQTSTADDPPQQADMFG